MSRLQSALSGCRILLCGFFLEPDAVKQIARRRASFIPALNVRWDSACADGEVCSRWFPHTLARVRVGAIHLAAWPESGRLAQLVERLLYTQNVGGSSPSPPTSLRKRSAAKAAAPKPILDVGGPSRLLRLGKPISFVTQKRSAAQARRQLPFVRISIFRTSEKTRPRPRNSMTAMARGR
jgi:hypothetical protein